MYSCIYIYIYRGKSQRLFRYVDALYLLPLYMYPHTRIRAHAHTHTVIVIVNLIFKVVVIVIVDKVIVIHYFFAITFCQTHNTFDKYVTAPSNLTVT